MLVNWNGMQLQVDDDLLLLAACRDLRRRNALVGADKEWTQYQRQDVIRLAAERAIGALEEELEIRVLLAQASSLDDLCQRLKAATVHDRARLRAFSEAPVFASKMPDWNYASDDLDTTTALRVDDMERDEVIVSYDAQRLLVMSRKRPFDVRILS